MTMSEAEMNVSEAEQYALDTASETDGSDLLVQISRSVDQLTKANLAVELAEAELKKRQEVARDLGERQIPELMQRARQKTLKTDSGITVTLVEKLRAAIPKGKEGPALAWLTENGHGGVIKREVSVMFGKDQGDLAKLVVDDIIRLGAMPENKLSVHPQTLAALLRELLEKGIDVPLEKFGAFNQTSTKLS